MSNIFALCKAENIAIRYRSCRVSYSSRVAVVYVEICATAVGRSGEFDIGRHRIELARRFFTDKKYSDAKAIAQSSVISSMPSVQRIVQLSRTIAVWTAACESSFGTLKRVLTPHRMAMLHSRKAGGD